MPRRGPCAGLLASVDGGDSFGRGYGILQYLGWDPWIDPRTYHVGTGVWTIVRPPGTLGYVTYFANYLVFGVFQGLALYRVEHGAGRDLRRWCWVRPPWC